LVALTTLKDFGQLVKQNPKMRRVYPEIDSFPSVELALKYLNQHPRYWSVISDQSERLRDLAENPVETARGFFESNTDFYQNQRQNIKNRAATIDYVYDASLKAEATSHGLSVEAYIHQQTTTHDVELQVRLERERVELELRKYWETARIDLDAADRDELKIHYQLNYLDSQLTHQYRRREELRKKRDRASKDELRLCNVRIKILEDQFNERTSVVSDSEEDGVFENPKSADGSSGRSAPDQAESESVPASKPGIGFRRDGDAS
jgi:hypothetical protein